MGMGLQMRHLVDELLSKEIGIGIAWRTNRRTGDLPLRTFWICTGGNRDNLLHAFGRGSSRVGMSAG